ncbi:MAG: hypothetical protein AAGG02_13400 [Cyanobacteria bacterium P01_H01_bin.15]
MTPTMLRQLWRLIEATQTQILLSMDDSELVQCLLNQLSHGSAFDSSQTEVYGRYIHTKLPLIRDLAQQRA